MHVVSHRGEKKSECAGPQSLFMVAFDKRAQWLSGSDAATKGHRRMRRNLNVRVGVFRHSRGNIGHAFMFAGISGVLDALSARLLSTGGPGLDLYPYEQHRPFSHLPWRSRDRALNGLPQHRASKWRSNAARRLLNGAGDRSAPFDLTIGLPGPIVVKGMASVPQVVSMMVGLHGWGRRASLPHFEFAVGSSFPRGGIQGVAALTPEDRALCRRLFSPPVWASARDVTTGSCLEDLGIKAPVIPDIAFAMSGQRQNIGGYTPRILVNLQRNGANSTYGRSEWSPQRWQSFGGRLITELEQLGQVSLLANDPTDADFLASLRPDVALERPRNVNEYLRLIQGADLVVATRVHAAVAACSQAVPSIGLGNDSRLGVLELLGVETFDSTVADVGVVRRSAELLLINSSEISKSLVTQKMQTRECYEEALWGEVMKIHSI